MTMFAYILGFAIGTAIGVIFYRQYIQKRVIPDGIIIFNKDDPDFATAGITFNEGADSIMNKKYITLKVKSHS